MAVIMLEEDHQLMIRDQYCALAQEQNNIIVDLFLVLSYRSKGNDSGKYRDPLVQYHQIQG